MAVVQKEVRGFMQFLSKGDVLDLAVGTILGASFSSIVDALTKDVLGPVLDLLTPNTMEGAFFTLRPGSSGGPYENKQDAVGDGAVIMGYGAFVQSCINFLLKGLCLFLLIRFISKMQNLKKLTAL